MDHKRRVAAEGPLARKRLKDQSHAATSPSSPMLLLDGPSNRATRTSMVKDIQDLDKMVEDSAYKELLPVVRKVRWEVRRDGRHRLHMFFVVCWSRDLSLEM